MHAAIPTRLDSHRADEWLDHVAKVLGADASGLLVLHPDGRQTLIAKGHSEYSFTGRRDQHGGLAPLLCLLSRRAAGHDMPCDARATRTGDAPRGTNRSHLLPPDLGHVITGECGEAEGTVWIVGVQRFQAAAPFSVAERKELDRLINAWRIGDDVPTSTRLDALDASLCPCGDVAAQFGLPLVAVDRRLVVVWANAAARDEHGTVWTALFDERTRVPAEVDLRQRLQALVLASLRQGAQIEALVASHDDTWFASVAPLNGEPGLVLLRVSGMHLGPRVRDRLQRLFGLTIAEAEMTVLLANGGSLRNIAERRGVSVDTVRTQLRTVFRKTGMHRQGELVCAVWRLAGC